MEVTLHCNVKEVGPHFVWGSPKAWVESLGFIREKPRSLMWLVNSSRFQLLPKISVPRGFSLS